MGGHIWPFTPSFGKFCPALQKKCGEVFTEGNEENEGCDLGWTQPAPFLRPPRRSLGIGGFPFVRKGEIVRDDGVSSAKWTRMFSIAMDALAQSLGEINPLLLANAGEAEGAEVMRTTRKRGE